MRRKRRRAQEAEAKATAEPAAATSGRRTVSVPSAPARSLNPPNTQSLTPNPDTPNPAGSSPVAAPVASVPDRVDALTEAIGGELGRLRGEIRGRDSDLVQALQQVAASYDRVAARLDDERRVQELLAEALVRIDRRLAAIEGKANPRDELARAQRVIGGSIAPRQDIPRIES